jgi:hypothetical protein
MLFAGKSWNWRSSYYISKPGLEGQRSHVFPHVDTRAKTNVYISFIEREERETCRHK